MSRSRRVRVALFAGMILIPGCSPESGERVTAGAAGPALIPIDSILLLEPDTLYIGNPYTPVIDPLDGSFHIPDIFSGRVLRFGRDGRLMLAYGRPGEGDTLFVLDRRINDGERLQTWILMYLVSEEPCDWLSTEPGGRGTSG